MNTMKRLQAYQYELQPNGQQRRDMRRLAGSCRFVFNKALAMQKARYKNGEKKLGYAGLCKALTTWRNADDTSWLADAPVHPLQQTLKDLERAYTNFFAKRADFPRFKKKGLGDSFRYPDAKQFKIDAGNSRVFLPKLGWIRYRNSRGILGTPKNITVSSNGGKWFVSIQTEREIEQLLPASTTAIGIDVGIARFATMSDGSFIAPLNSFKKHQQRLAKYQRRMSRKVKFSSNWKKAKAKVQRIHSNIANVRKDYLHKCSTTISQNHALVCIEDLQVRNMSKSSKGSSEQHGKMVKQKSGLNRSILDQGWGEFRRQLEYKVSWSGGILLAVPPHNTSRTCPCCGYVAKENRITQAVFLCVDCGYENHADLVGAINVLSRGMKMLEGQDTADASAGCASTARIACEVNGAVMPSAAGTHRSDYSGACPCLVL
jgi:putative transposase